jgi:tetratricopeptide (TPR) repeat protein
MAEINLRYYGRVIKSLLEQEKAAEALEHCRYILMSFPKHIQTYRLFGEANLEMNRYLEASELFTRLLSSVPDDYIAHIGMSVISEEAGRLEAALSHMARAFEIQPYNLTIQNELRRLIGQRDGIEIRKLSLTRPALARMYVRGGLDTQAIAEISSILVDQPQRYDLVVLLANLRYKNGSYEEAAVLAHTVLQKIPYCLEAIRLLVNILPYGSLAYDRDMVLNKYHDLDPYTRHLEYGRGDAATVPDNLVYLEWLSTFPEPPPGANQVSSETSTTPSTQNHWMYEEEADQNLNNHPDAQIGQQGEWKIDNRDILQ